MRWIQKSSEPTCLTTHRATTVAADWNNLSTDCKDDIRKKLVADQRGLCAFCMKPIDVDRMKIAHRHPRTAVDGQGLELTWRNYLGVCTGNEGSAEENQTCDTHQKNILIDIDPITKPHIARIAYTSEGHVGSSHPPHQHEIDTVLNLNTATLVRARRQALTGLLEFWNKGQGTWSNARIKARIAQIQSDSRLPPFFGYIEWWMRRRTG